MRKKMIIGLGLCQLLLADMTHSFYFDNKYEVVKENAVTEGRMETKEVISPAEKDIKSQLKVKITILEKPQGEVGETRKPSVERQNLWNPLNGFFKYQNEEDKAATEELEKDSKDYDMENSRYYVLNILTHESDIVDYNFFQIKNEKNIESYTKNKNNIIIKGDLLAGKFYILNKKSFVDFHDKFVIKFHNKRLELEYLEYPSGLFGN